MKLKLPRFLNTIKLVTDKGTPSLAFHQWWEQVVKQIELFSRRFPSLIVSPVSTTGPLSSDNYLTLVDASAGATTVTLPPALNKQGSQLIVKKVDPSINAVTVDGYDGETIDGVATKSLASQYDSITLVSDGVEWWVV